MTKKLSHLLLLVSTVVLLTGCFSHTYTTGTGAKYGSPQVFSAWQSHWLLGLLNTELPVPVSQFCPTGNATIEEEHTFANLLVGVLIGIVWFPTTVRIYCDIQGDMAPEMTPAPVPEAAPAPAPAPEPAPEDEPPHVIER